MFVRRHLVRWWSVPSLALLLACGSTERPGTGTRHASAPVRARQALTEGWRFSGAGAPASGPEIPEYDDSAWATVAVPHTWNLEAARFDTSGQKLPFATYDNAWYRLHLRLAPAEERVYFVFEGVGTIADVWLNGQKLGQHRGAYTRFVFDGTLAARFGEDNVLAVKVDNTDASATDVLPATPLARNYYKPYGGIYRKAWLLTTDRVAIDPTDHATSGVYVTPAPRDDGSALVAVRTLLRNDTEAPVTAELTHRILDQQGSVVASATSRVDLAAPARSESNEELVLPNAHRWDTRDPFLYRLETRLSVDGRERDRVTERFGVRSFELRPDGFFLNGVNTPLRGVSKHQESETHRAAMTDAELTADFDGLSELGANFVRLVHYPHAEREYELADERGLVIWAENGNSTPNAPTDTGEAITRDMVRQAYNHPSVAFYSAANESIVDEPSLAASERYVAALRDEDPTRPTIIAVFADPSSFSEPGLDFVATNEYSGWYYGGMWDFDATAPAVHYISETGGRCVATQHSEAAAAGDVIVGSFEPEEYTSLLAESRMQTVFVNAPGAVPLFAWWVYRDFLLDGRPHDVNDSGLVSADGTHRKDTFYVLQSFYRPDFPVVHLASKYFFVRTGAAPTALKAYSNRPSLTLRVNGASQGTLANGVYVQPVDAGHPVKNVFAWPVVLRDGMNDIAVSDDAGHEDHARLYFAGTGGDPADAAARPLLVNLALTGSTSPAYYFDGPFEDGSPVYADFAGIADNSFLDVPAELSGAGRIVTLALNRPEYAASVLSFAAREDGSGAEVLVMASASSLPPFLDRAGFADTGVHGLWRNRNMDRTRFGLFAKRLAAGESLAVGPGDGMDWVVFVR